MSTVTQNLLNEETGFELVVERDNHEDQPNAYLHKSCRRIPATGVRSCLRFGRFGLYTFNSTMSDKQKHRVIQEKPKNPNAIDTSVSQKVKDAKDTSDDKIPKMGTRIAINAPSKESGANGEDPGMIFS